MQAKNNMCKGPEVEHAGMFKEHKVRLELARQREKGKVRSERKPSPDHLSFLGHWWDFGLILSMVGGLWRVLNRREV